MPKSKTTYNPKWEKLYDFISEGTDKYKAHCNKCDREISIKSGGKADINRHVNGAIHDKRCRLRNTTRNQEDEPNATTVDENNNVLNLSPEEVLKAETMQALKVVSSNFSFASCHDDGDRFRQMFPDSTIAKNYHQSRTKVNYVIKHGISPFVKDHYLKDFKGSPFVFKFDETTTRQVKKQYDGYIQYWSPEQNLVSSVYCGSLFLGHCFSKDLLNHFNAFGDDLQWESDLLLQIGMDGPNVNLKFEQDLSNKIQEEYGVSFLNIGSCSLHKTHNAFRKGVLDFGFDIETFVYDTNFFFKSSAARRQDYKLMEVFTEIESKYVLKHVSSRWLSIKKPILRILEQWENLSEYFLKFLPKEKKFAHNIKPKLRYKRITDFLKDPTSKASLCFIAFVSTEFEDY